MLTWGTFIQTTVHRVPSLVSPALPWCRGPSPSASSSSPTSIPQPFPWAAAFSRALPLWWFINNPALEVAYRVKQQNELMLYCRFSFMIEHLSVHHHSSLSSAVTQLRCQKWQQKSTEPKTMEARRSIRFTSFWRRAKSLGCVWMIP